MSRGRRMSVDEGLLLGRERPEGDRLAELGGGDLEQLLDTRGVVGELRYLEIRVWV